MGYQAVFLGLEKKKGYSEHMRSFVYLLKSRTIFSFSPTPLDLPGIVYLKEFFPQTQIFWFLHQCNLMVYTFHILN